MPPIEEQEYYVLSASETKEKNHHLWFVATKQISYGELTNNVNHALLTTNYVADHEDEIYLKKEDLQQFVYATIEEKRYVNNTRDTRNKLGLKYKDGKLVRATGEGVEEDYVLLLNEAREDRLGLPFMKEDGFGTIVLEKASIQEEPFKGALYIAKSKAESLATKFPDGSLILLNCEENLKALGLHYVESQLCVLEEEEAAPGAESEEEVRSEREEPSILKIGANLYGLYQELKKLRTVNKPKPTLLGINDLADQIHQVNREKGFWDKERNVGEMLMLVSSELGEAMEAHRKGKFAKWEDYHKHVAKVGAKKIFEVCIKDSFEDEIADATIRLLDMAAGLDVDLEKHIQSKLDYNRTRERFHGKEY